MVINPPVALAAGIFFKEANPMRSNKTLYVVMSYRDEEHNPDAPSNGIATHGAYESRDAARNKVDLLEYLYPDTVSFWVEEAELCTQ
jgi:hypothetical protein